MDIKSILNSKNFDEPDEIRTIKNFVKQCYDSEVKVSLADNQIIVSAPSAPLIASLRTNLPELVKAANTDKKIIFRIS